MPKMNKSRKPNKDSPYAIKGESITIGRSAFAKISAVEGITMTKSMAGTFHELDRKNASPEVRRKTLVRKYGK